MVSAAVQPRVVARFVRAAAGRRALRVLVLLAGLVVIGLVCGERARAADGGAAATDVVRSVVGGVPGTSGASRAPDAAESDVAESDVADVGEPAAKSGARPVVERVARPARGVVDGAARAVDEVRSGELPDVRSRALPDVRRVLPEAGRVLPEPQELLPEPARPGAGAGRGDEGGAGATTPVPPAVEDGGEGKGDKDGKRNRDGRGDRSVGDSRGGRAAAYGPGLDSSYPHGGWTPPSGDGSGERARDAVQDGAAFGEHGTGGRGQGPMPGRPGGCVSGQSAGDGSSQRHAEQCAAGFGGRGEVRLAAGACASAGADPVRERHRDVLEFPG
ncbi:hypothetical protein GCM10012286_61490 [Streptomyces lasiicapitis]|uniref:Secreted protein n=1 Tax=Streptomyces lasiicapitis TaxID=1923961 RepID=A0ABQ2MKV0_9ACTN|nr:hypothetical protein GCM10012286_61490 [Streptomyces lasiicapitis]